MRVRARCDEDDDAGFEGTRIGGDAVWLLRMCVTRVGSRESAVIGGGFDEVRGCGVGKLARGNSWCGVLGLCG